jgi:hypothetical protein
MSPRDFTIFKRFMRLIQQTENIRAYFDVGVGEGEEIHTDEKNENYARMWRRNTQKRIDVLLLFEGKEVWIIEVREEATGSAIGRLIMYRKLYWEDDPFNLPVRLVLVTNEYDKEVEKLALSQKIAYYVV